MNRLVALLAAAWLLSGCASGGSALPGNRISLKQAAQYNVELGIAYLRQGQRDLAMQKLQKALEQNPDNADAYMGLGLLYDTIGDTERADHNYRIALRKAPDNPQIQNNYAVFLCQHGQLQKSEKYFIEAARNPLYPTPEAAYTNAGVCANRIPDVAAAEQYFRKALDINPNFPDALYQMARLSYAQKKYLQARAFLERFDLVTPQPQPEALLLGVETERALGNARGASEYTRKLLTQFPNSPQAQELLQGPGHGGRGR